MTYTCCAVNKSLLIAPTKSTRREVKKMNHYPRTPEEQEQLRRGVEKLDRKMEAEEEAYWERIRQSEKRTDSLLRQSMAFSIASLLAVILATLLLWR
jgi:hypothetical protein